MDAQVELTDGNLQSLAQTLKLMDRPLMLSFLLPRDVMEPRLWCSRKSAIARHSPRAPAHGLALERCTKAPEPGPHRRGGSRHKACTACKPRKSC
jgi:hypothetical protein